VVKERQKRYAVTVRFLSYPSTNMGNRNALETSGNAYDDER